MKPSPARLLAREAITRVRERSAFAHETLDALLSRGALDRRDAALATRLTYGTVAARGTLDDAIADLLSPGVTLEPRVSDALALSAYEILFLRTPSRASVNEGVELVRTVRPAASGLANAVLRKLAVKAGGFPWGDPENDIEALARLHAHPTWLTRMWVDELGRDRTAGLLAADNEPAPFVLAAIDPSLTTSDLVNDLAAGSVPAEQGMLPLSVVSSEPAAAVRSSALSSGRAIVMDEGAQFVAGRVPLHESATILEIGAGRGGKTLLMSSAATRAGLNVRFLAVDIHPAKLDSLARAAERAGLPAVDTVVADATSPTSPGLPAAGSADVVLVDAPCSGLGTLRRHPDRRWRASEGEIETLAQIGSRLLTTAAALVKPGGFVVYSTCTIAHRENAGVISGFLASGPGEGFSLDLLNAEVPEAWRHHAAPEGWFQAVPEPGGPDGHFVARLIRSR